MFKTYLCILFIISKHIPHDGIARATMANSHVLPLSGADKTRRAWRHTLVTTSVGRSPDGQISTGLELDDIEPSAGAFSIC